MDFYKIKERSLKKGYVDIYPDFKICRSKDLMVRGRSFYAIWDEEKQMWSIDEYDVQRIIDRDLMEYREEAAKRTEDILCVKLMSDFSTNSWVNFRKYISSVSDNAHQLDEKLTFSNTQVTKKDYVSKRLDYPLEKGSYDAFDELIGTLYDQDERAKLEWAIGSIVSGDAKDIQKFIVLYGEHGTGKSTILNIIQKLFKGYYTAFEAKALASASNSFSTEVFKNNPLVAIQHDGDLSRIEDNTKLNSIISHEDMNMNEKYKPGYMAHTNCFLFMGTNKPVKITDAKSGIIRRLIDVRPSGKKLPPKKYQALMTQIEFELGAIAYHCLEVYREMGKNYYSGYRPVEMILQTDVFYNFVDANFYTFKAQEGISLAQAYEMYKQYCDESLVEFKLPKHKFREELKSYFQFFEDRVRIDDKQVRSYYSGFLDKKFSSEEPEKEEHQSSLVLDCETSILDTLCSECQAQYGSNFETPKMEWSKVTTKLSDLDTTKLHYMKLPINHIVIDFDLKNEKGEKSAERNLEAASKWPSTYAEFSKGGKGIHLHYIYDGDATRLSRVYEEDIEIKVFVGNSSLRRRLSKCNNIPVATINSGLPLKGATMINVESVKSERSLRDMIKRNLNKEIHPGTKPSIDFINKILDDAYKSGLSYDVTDLRPKIMAFANNSSHQADYCLKLVSQMKFQSEEISEPDQYKTNQIVFFDVEVFPNLFLVNWKFQGKDKKIVRMINPSPQEIGELFKYKLIAFNNRRYDNHILYARYIGYSNEELYQLSKRIINGSRNAMFGEAYNISYTDVYDFASAANKKSLKKWEIELGIHHMELGLPWDEPVPEEKWPEVAAYCDNDVYALEAVFDHLQGDWTARQILAELSGLTVNDTTNQHAIKIIFGNNKNPQSQFNYTDLSEMFPGYTFDHGKSLYRDEEVGEGGYVYAEPGMYGNVALLDVASMHPTSIELLNLFGPYTKRFSDVKSARILIKHNDIGPLHDLLDGKLSPFVEKADGFSLDDLSNALKTVINSIYGLTSAKFDNPCRDPRNIDNIVAKRGALFMIDLKHAVQEKGFQVAHIKTDSIKIPDATDEIISFVMEFGKKYGYAFEHEATMDKICLVNDAVYITKYKWHIKSKKIGQWDATGAQFAQPYVFKTLFSKQPIEFQDMCETKSVTTSMYLDMNESLGEEEHNYQFVGKTGLFCPIKPGCGGGILLREKEGKYYAVGGTKGYRWLEAEIVKALGKEEDVDLSYYKELVDASIKDIDQYGDFEWFASEDIYTKQNNQIYPF